jgi:transposase
MRQKQDDQRAVEKAVRDSKHRTRRKFSPEEKIRIVLQGLHGEGSIAELCRGEGLHQNQYSAAACWPEASRGSAASE